MSNNDFHKITEQNIALEKSKGNGANQDLQGIKGWLIVVAIIVTVAPIVIAVETFVSLYINLIGSEEWGQLTDPTSDYYYPSIKILVGVELFFNILLFCAWLVAIFLFFSKKASFKKFFVCLLIMGPILQLLDVIIASYMLDVSAFDYETSRGIGRSIISALIWTAYIKNSRRVANTFIK